MKREISIENGFQIVMIFLTDFWWKFLKELMINKKLIKSEIKKIKDSKGRLRCRDHQDILHDYNDFFFLTVCDGTSDDYFEDVIEKRMNIPPIKQHQGLIVQEDLLLQLAIDFCEYFNKRFQEEGRDSLRFAINWLEDMRKNPDKHKAEWEMWNKVVVDVTKHGQKSLGFF